MASSNIEKFDAMTGKVFAELYQSFPVPTTLLVEDFIERSAHSSEESQSNNSNECEFFIATCEWLMQAGYLTGNSLYIARYTEAGDAQVNQGIGQAVLTAKGLEVLKAIPKSVISTTSIGEQLATTAKEGGKEVARGLVSEALGLGVKILSPMLGLT